MTAQIRRWCSECQRTTLTWMDAVGVERCSGHEPESRVKPGYAQKDLVHTLPPEVRKR